MFPFITPSLPCAYLGDLEIESVFRERDLCFALRYDIGCFIHSLSHNVSSPGPTGQL